MNKLISYLIILLSFSNNYAQTSTNTYHKTENLKAVLDTIWQTEQVPIRKRDSILNVSGDVSKEFQYYQSLYRKNHSINIKKVSEILNVHGWPSKDIAGENGNRIICNVIQHTDNATRLKYLPIMREAVKNNLLEPTLLARAEDRIATERGDLQLYGGQMKYYSDTKTFNLWPIYDPVNIDERRAEIGLEPIATFLMRRFNFVWNLEEQIKRTKQFEIEMNKINKKTN